MWARQSRSTQPGLEVVYIPNAHYGHSDPEAVPYGQGLIVAEGENEKVPYTTSAPYSQYHASSATSTPGTLPELSSIPFSRTAPRTPWWRHVWVVWAGIVLLALAVGGIVGGVLGSHVANNNANRASNDAQNSDHGSGSGSGGDSRTNDTSGANTANLAGAIMENSRLATTGWYNNTDGSFEIRLAYQGPDHKVRMSTYLSTSSEWSAPTVMDIIKARPGTPLSMSTFIEEEPHYLRTFYAADTDNILRGAAFYSSDASKAVDDAISEFKTPVHAASRITSYLPMLLVLDTDGNLNRFQGKESFGPSGKSKDEIYGQSHILDSKIAPGSGMVVLPIAAKYSEAGGFVYTNPLRELSVYMLDTNNKGKDGWSWTPGATGLSVPGSSSSSNNDNSSAADAGAALSVGAFVVAQDDVGDNMQIHSYALFQDALSPTGDILAAELLAGKSAWTWQDKSPALQGADKGTDIACVTAQAWNGMGIRISTNRAINRCYFQVGRQVREVQYDGSSWSIVGYLPIPLE